MRNAYKYIYITILLLLLLSITACNSGLNNINTAINTQDTTGQDTENITESDTGFASFKIVIPDYYAMVGLARNNKSRAIAPQTTKVVLSLKKANYWTAHSSVILSEAEKTEIPNAPEGFVGSVYKCSFPKVPSGNYAAGTMKIDLLDSEDNVISSGTNNNALTIIAGGKTQASFYTIPTNSDSDSGSLAAGEMKFLKKRFDSEHDYTLSISRTGNSFPDLVIFNENGTFEKYIAVSATNNDIDCSEYKGTTKYFGFWSANATSYSTSFITNLNTINQTFEEELDSDIWITSGIAEVIDCDPVYAAWEQYGDALVDTHGKVFKIEEYSSLTIFRITVVEESSCSFDYKSDDIWTPNIFNVYIDNNSEPSFQATDYRQIWQKGSIILSSGTHSIKFEPLTTTTYIDNITLAPNTTESVDIYPKGLQETYIDGDTIQFSAKALRSDGSVINGKNVTWTSTGGSIDENGLFAPGNVAGIYTVTAIIDGKTASNQTVKVHGSDYLSDSVIINGHEFTGAVTNISGSPSDTTNITWATPTPEGSYFTTDGFFVLKGTTNDTYGYVIVTKNDYQTYYILQKGKFEQRIWLRFGDGEYSVSVIECEINYRSPNGNYEGALESFGSAFGRRDFTVINNTGVSYSEEECAYLMPSYICQSDDFIVSNAFNAVIAALPEDAALGQKLQALHDWEINMLHYDDYTVNHKEERKAQDAVHVVKYGMAVCEGYANLYTALARLLGVQTAYQSSSSMNHAWVECFYNGEWKLVDATWDDGIVGDKITPSESYTYFLINRTGVDGDHHDNEPVYSRSIIPIHKTPHVKDMPDGWY